MSWFSGPNISSLLKLLEREDATVEMVLDDPAFNPGLKNSHGALISFLVENENNLNHLLDIAFTDFTPDTPIPAKTIRNAVQVLSSSTIRQIMNVLNSSKPFIKRINEFPKSQYATHPRCCGHFSKVIEAFLRYDSQFLKKVPTLRDFIMNGMVNIGMRELFIYLCNEQQQIFGITREFLIDLTSHVTPETGFYVVTGISQALSFKPRDINPFITNVDLIRNLITIGKSAEHRIITRVEAFMLAEKAMKKITNDEIQNLIKEQSESFDFDTIENDSLLGGALRVLHTKSEKILLRILKPNQSTFVNNGIIQSFNALTPEELQEFIIKTNFIKQLMETFPPVYSNSHLSQIAKIIYQSEIEANNDEFKKFYTDVVEERVTKRSEDYGGERPHQQLSSEESDSSIGETQPADDDFGEDLFGSNSSSSSSDSDDSDDDDGSSFGVRKHSLFSHNDSSSDSSDSDSDDDSDDNEGAKFSLKRLQNPQLSLHQSSSSSSEEDSDSLDAPKPLPELPNMTNTLPPLPKPLSGPIPPAPPLNFNINDDSVKIPPLFNPLKPLSSSSSDDDDNNKQKPILPSFPGLLNPIDNTMSPQVGISEDLPSPSGILPPPPQFGSSTGKTLPPFPGLPPINTINDPIKSEEKDEAKIEEKKEEETPKESNEDVKEEDKKEEVVEEKKEDTEATNEEKQENDDEKKEIQE